MTSETTAFIVAATFLSVVLVVLLSYWFIRSTFETYEDKFAAGDRLSRSNYECRSSLHLDPPDMIVNARTTPSSINRANPQGEEDSRNEDGKEQHQHDNQQQETKQGNKEASRRRATEHNMDHVYLNFFQFLWAFAFVGPFSYMLWKRATLILKLRVFLVEKWGWTFLKRHVSSLEEVVGKLVLEQSQVIYYTGQRRVQRFDENGARMQEDQKIASFFFPNFPIVNMSGEFQVVDHLAVDIDIDTKKMVSCTLDEEPLNASEALILLWYNTIMTQHVKIHAYGNWGANPSAEMKDVNPYYERSSIVSVIYNYFGFTSFVSFMQAWRDEGLLSKDWDPKAVTATFEHGVKENICEHSNITELLPYSDMVRFVTKTRWMFHKEFQKHSHLFPGVNAEGLFAATVLHSLDHELMEWNLEDPLWLDVKDARFGKMAEHGRIVRVGFVPQVPGYYFNRYFKGSGHPFFEAVYLKASKVNKKMADCLETCICR